MILDLDMDGSISEPDGNANKLVSIKKQRRISRPLSAPFSDSQCEIPPGTVKSVAVPIITPVVPINDTPLDVDEITKRRPTLPDLSVIASDIAGFAPGRPYANTSEYNSSSSVAASPHQSVISLPQNRASYQYASKSYPEQHTHSRHGSQTSTPHSPSHSTYCMSQSITKSDTEIMSSTNATVDTTLPVNTSSDIVQTVDIVPTNETTEVQPNLSLTVNASHSPDNTFNDNHREESPAMDSSTSELISYNDPITATPSTDDTTEQDETNLEESSTRKSTKSIKRNHLKPSSGAGSLSRKSTVRRKKKDAPS
jgi:hypothetical protein